MFIDQETGYKSNFLIDFAKLKRRPTDEYIRKVLTNQFDHDLYNLLFSQFDPSQIQFLEGVVCDYTTPKINTIENYNLSDLKSDMLDILTKKLKPLSNQKAILFLSCGVDSLLLLHICLELNIKLKCIYVASLYNKDEIEDICRIRDQYNIDVEIIDNYDPLVPDQDYYRYFHLNPSFQNVGAIGPVRYYNILKDPMYSEYKYVLTGHEVEVTLDMIPLAIYNSASDQTQFKNYNKIYGKYVNYNFNQLTKQSIENLFNYSRYERVIKRLTMCRDYAVNELLTGKHYVKPYKNEKLVSAALSLSNEDVIANAYKIPSYEILDDVWNFKTPPKKLFGNANKYEKTFNMLEDSMDDPRSNVLQTNKVWLKNYMIQYNKY
jgi:hypothetical protein